MTDHIIAYTESPNPVFRLFKKLRMAMDEPERVDISVEDTEIQFEPIDDDDEGLKITQSTGDVSAAGVVSRHELELEEGRYEAVSVDKAVWAIDIGEGKPDPVGGRIPIEDELREALEADNIEETFTVDEIRVKRTKIDDGELLEALIEADDRNSAVEAYEKQLTDLRG